MSYVPMPGYQGLLWCLLWGNSILLIKLTAISLLSIPKLSSNTQRDRTKGFLPASLPTNILKKKNLQDLPLGLRVLQLKPLDFILGKRYKPQSSSNHNYFPSSFVTLVMGFCPQTFSNLCFSLKGIFLLYSS